LERKRAIAEKEAQFRRDFYEEEATDAKISEEERQKEDEEINKILDKLVTIKLAWGGIATLQRRDIKSRITICVKTLFGARKSHNISVSILNTPAEIRKILGQIYPDEMESFHTIKIIYPMTKLYTLN